MSKDREHRVYGLGWRLKALLQGKCKRQAPQSYWEMEARRQLSITWLMLFAVFVLIIAVVVAS